MSSSEMIQGLEQASQKHEKEIVIELGSDRILHYVGVYLIIVLAVITKISDLAGKNLSCFPANKSTGYNAAFINYASTYCWETPVENVKNLNYCNGFNETKVNLLKKPNLIKGFVQWMPYAMLLEAFLFALPSAWWHFRVGARLMGHLKFMQLLLNDIYESVKTIPAGIYRKKPYDRDGVYLNGWLPFKKDYKTIDQQGLGVEEETGKQTKTIKKSWRANIFRRIFRFLRANTNDQSTPITGDVNFTAKKGTDSTISSALPTPIATQQPQSDSEESKNADNLPDSKQSSVASSHNTIVIADVHLSRNESKETFAVVHRSKSKHDSEPEIRKDQDDDVSHRSDSNISSVVGSHHSIQKENEPEDMCDEDIVKENEDRNAPEYNGGNNTEISIVSGKSSIAESQHSSTGEEPSAAATKESKIEVSSVSDESIDEKGHHSSSSEIHLPSPPSSESELSAVEDGEISPNQPLITPLREKRKMTVTPLYASPTRAVHSEEATSGTDSEKLKILTRTKSADQIPIKKLIRKKKKKEGSRQKKGDNRAIEISNSPKDLAKMSPLTSDTEKEVGNLLQKSEKKHKYEPEQSQKTAKKSSISDILEKDVTATTEDDHSAPKKREQSKEKNKIYLKETITKVEVLETVADDQFSEENTDDEKRMKKKDLQDSREATKPPTTWEKILVGGMLDQHLFSMLCYENFASLEYHPYIMSVYQLTATMAAEGDKRGIFPLKQGILRQFCHKDNFKSRFLVKSYMVRSIVSILLAIVVLAAITLMYQNGIGEILNTKLFGCEIAFTKDTPLLCTLERTSDILAMFFANWAIIAVYTFLSCWQLYFVRTGNSRALSHYFKDMQDSCSVALLAAHKAAKAAVAKEGTCNTKP